MQTSYTGPQTLLESYIKIRSTTINKIRDAMGAGLSFTGSALDGALSNMAIAVVADENE